MPRWGALVALALAACQPAAGGKPDAPGQKKPLRKADVSALEAGLAHHPPERRGPEPGKPVHSSDADQWLQSSGLYDLSKVTLPPGAAEVRLWDDIGVVNGTVVQKRGKAFHGAQVFLPEDCTPDDCSGWVVALEPCVPWDQLWQGLVDQGVMEAPDGSEPAAASDGAETYTIEVQSDGKYWVKQYVLASDTSPAAKKVKALDALMNESLYCH